MKILILLASLTILALNFFLMKCKATPAWWKVQPNIGIEGQRHSLTRRMGLSVSKTTLTILILLVTMMIDVSKAWCHAGFPSRTLTTYTPPTGEPNFNPIADYEYIIGTGNYQFTVPEYD